MYKFSEIQKNIEEAVKEVVEGLIDSKSNERNNNKEYPKNILKILGELGYNSLMIPKEYGGSGLDAVSSLIVLKEIAKADASIAHIIETINFGFLYPIYLLGTEEQKRKYLTLCSHGEKTGTLAYNEPDKEITTTAEEDGDYYIINGRKTLITDASYADYALLYAKTDKNANGASGYSMFILDLKNTQGITIGKDEDTMGLQSLKVADIYLQNVKIHKSDMLFTKNKGVHAIVKAMEIMRIANGAVALGIAERAYREALEYSKIRTIDNIDMCEMQVIRYKFADMRASLENMELLTFYSAQLYDMKEKNIMLYSSISKLKVTEEAKTICDECLQIFGGYGYIRGYTVERLYRDVRVMTIIGGISELMRSSISYHIF